MTPFDPIRGFDGIRSSSGNLRGTVGLSALDKAMWRRILEHIPYRTEPFYAAATPAIMRIGYGRIITDADAPLDKKLDSRWLRIILSSFYTRLVMQNPEAPLNEVLASVLYYYEEQYAPSEE